MRIIRVLHNKKGHPRVTFFVVLFSFITTNA
jgi:hypothetical protein